MKTGSYLLLAALASVSQNTYSAVPVQDGWGSSLAPNTGGIINTRHNLTQKPWFGSTTGNMDRARNDYGEVCVYCHTPHAANTDVSMASAPLWNRTKPQATFSVYTAPRMQNQPITEPGVNSLTCLSCHDGVTAIDSVINMPGSGGYSAGQQTSVNTTFLDSWAGPGGTAGHATLTQCSTACHNASSVPFGGSDFSVFIIGADLKDDHPVGVLYPASIVPGVDFAEPTVKNARLAFFDTNVNGRADTNEIRMYDTGGGYEVECASCHDPHGVPSAGPGSRFIPSFLRVNNAAQSKLCLTCHVK